MRVWFEPWHLYIKNGKKELNFHWPTIRWKLCQFYIRLATFGFIWKFIHFHLEKSNADNDYLQKQNWKLKESINELKYIEIKFCGNDYY